MFFLCSLFSCAGVRRTSSSAVKLMKVLVAVQRCEYTDNGILRSYYVFYFL
jgi:hypothetical protein